MSDEQYKVSVVIPVKDDPVRLNRCLDALEASDYQGEFEILIVDNGSSIGLRADVSGRSQTRLLWEPRGNSYSARNRGIAHATGSIVAFTDADCLPASDWISNAVELIRDSSVTAVAGRVEVFARDPKRPSLAEIYDLIDAFPQRRYVERFGFGVTANLVVRAAALAEVGGFDVRASSGGDRDLGERLGGAGLRLVYGNDVVVRHPARASMRELYDKRVRVFTGALLARHFKGEKVTMSLGETFRRLLPPRSAVRCAVTDPRLADNRARIRFVIAATVVRYLDFVAWRVAGRAVSRATTFGADRESTACAPKTSSRPRKPTD